MIAVCVLGMGLAIFSILYFTVDAVLVKLQALSIARQFEDKKPNPNRRMAIGAALGFIAGMMITNGTVYMGTAGMAGAGLGAGLIEIMSRLSAWYKEDQSRKECFLLFNAVELYIQSGLSIPQALGSAKIFTPVLQSTINRVLAAWPQGSIQALEILREGIDLPEGDQLVSLLIQINQMGHKNLQNIMSAQSRQFEERRNALKKARITQKPIFLTAYRLLPLVVLLGMLAGLLITRIFVQINGLV